jgi:hypothetical protein
MGNARKILDNMTSGKGGMTLAAAKNLLVSRGVDISNPKEVGAACYQFFSELTGWPEKERDEEGYFGGVIDEFFLGFGNGVASEEFQDGWNEAQNS